MLALGMPAHPPPSCSASERGALGSDTRSWARENRTRKKRRRSVVIGALEVRLATSGVDLRPCPKPAAVIRSPFFYQKEKKKKWTGRSRIRRASCGHAAMPTASMQSAFILLRGWTMIVTTPPEGGGNLQAPAPGDRGAASRFYSQGEYDIAPVLAAHPDMRFLETGALLRARALP